MMLAFRGLNALCICQEISGNILVQHLNAVLYTSFLHKDGTIHNVLMFGEVGMLGGGIGV